MGDEGAAEGFEGSDFHERGLSKIRNLFRDFIAMLDDCQLLVLGRHRNWKIRQHGSPERIDSRLGITRESDAVCRLDVTGVLRKADLDRWQAALGRELHVAVWRA